MLNPFPSLLVYGFFAPTILRAAVAIVLAWAAWSQWSQRKELSHTRFLFVGSGMWTVWVMLVLELAAAAGLLFGYYTQWAAILGALISIKFAVWDHRYPKFFPLSRPAALLMLALCLSLLLSGAGALAYDLPL